MRQIYAMEYNKGSKHISSKKEKGQIQKEVTQFNIIKERKKWQKSV